MILHTVMPEDIVWQGLDEKPQETMEITLSGIRMEIRPISRYEASIVRIYSPVAADYLNPRWAPGSVVRMVPAGE